MDREPGRRRASKREEDAAELSEAELVALLRLRSWSWLTRARPAADATSPSAAVAEPEAPAKRKRAPRRDAAPPPEGVLALRRKAWAWFAPRATGEARAGSHKPHGLAGTGAPASSGDVVSKHLKGVLEALIFASERPLPAKELARLAKTDVKIARALLAELCAEYHGRGFRLDEVGGGFAFRTSPIFAPFVREQVAKKPVRMSRAQVETLAIVAYRQPITRPEIDDVRGVDSGAVLKSLLERELVRIIGKKDEPGRPMLYATTVGFLELFGLKALGDLPTLREFTELTDESKRTFEREIGEDAPDASAGAGLMGGEGELRRGSVDLGAAAALDPAAYEDDLAPPDEATARAEEPAAGATDDAEEDAQASGSSAGSA